MKKQIAIILILCYLVTLSTALASTLADSVFDYTATNLSSSKSASFLAETFNTASSIKVTRVRLYKKNDSNNWVYIQDLSVPTEESTNSYYYASNKDYSDSIDTGTYRLYVTYCADGHSISRYSNTRTY